MRYLTTSVPKDRSVAFREKFSQIVSPFGSHNCAAEPSVHSSLMSLSLSMSMLLSIHQGAIMYIAFGVLGENGAGEERVRKEQHHMGELKLGDVGDLVSPSRTFGFGWLV